VSDETAERYLRLALRLARHDGGVVDAYFGRHDLEQEVDQEPLASPADLLADAERLLDDLPDGWLGDQVLALRTVAARLAGERLSYPDEVEACYGVRPARTDPAVLRATYDALDALLPGTESLWNRYRAWEESLYVPAATIEALMAALVEEARSQTRDLVGLPDGESIELQYVRDTPWLGYHEYLGDLRGRISVNIDLPRSASSLLHLAVHETYAGHQAERCHKEIALVRERGLLEETIALVAAPQSLVSEGLAELAREMLLDGGGGPAFEAVMRDHDVALDLSHTRAVERAAEPLGWLGVDASLMLHEDGVPAPEVSSYLHEHALIGSDEADRWVRFLQDPGSRSYAVCYPAGLERCRAFTAGDPARFRRLLTEQMRVSDLVAPL
jgi:hypothetical protein